MKCPECNKTGSLHRSRSRNMLEQIIRHTTFMKTFRCNECGWRGFRSTVVITKKSIRTLTIYFILILITAILARYLLLNFIV